MNDYWARLAVVRQASLWDAHEVTPKGIYDRSLNPDLEAGGPIEIEPSTGGHHVLASGPGAWPELTKEWPCVL